MLLQDILTKDFLETEYVYKKRFARDIAREVGCSTVSVTNYLRKYCIPIENRYDERKGYLGDRNPARDILTKDYLQREYVEKNRSQTSISQELNCSITLVREALINSGISVDKNKSKTQIAEANGLYHSYVTEDKGYLCIRLPNHPKANNRGYVRLHVLLAEYYFGVEVKEDEVVHHKNEKKQDNQKQNLKIMKKVEHDRLHFAKRRLAERRKAAIQKICRPTVKRKR